MVGYCQLNGRTVGIGPALAVDVDAKVVPVPAQFSHGRVDGQKVFGRGSAEGHNYLGADGSDLPHQEGNAGFALVALRGSIPGRAALHHVGDVNIFAAQTHGRDHVVEQLPGAAHEGQALFVLVGARTFAHKHQFGMDVACAKDDVFAAFAEAAASALANVFADGA